MIYNFNLGIGWASSGVEYAQIYRARILRNIGQKAKFVFMDMFPRDNIEHMTKNIGFFDEEIIWLYSFFTDCKIASVSYTLSDLEKTFQNKKFTFSRDKKIAKYIFDGENNFYTVYMVDETSDLVHRVEMVSRGFLIRKDYYTYCKIYSEYYAPLDGKAHMYNRRFFNEDGSVAYEEINDEESVLYQFPDKILYSKEELVGYLVSRLNLTSEDIVIIDRTTGIGQAILQNCGNARVGLVIHADHFSENQTDHETVLWNNYYEYAFAMHKHIDFYISSTDAQNQLLKKQFETYMHVSPTIYTVPVGSIAELRYPKTERKKHSVITASRLATEKHVDWIVEAVIRARKSVPDVTLDIYGKGGEEKKLQELIEKNQAQSYIRLCGQQDLTDVYTSYEAYLAGSTSEGFGLTLLEAVGSGLPIIGFDVRYGNQTFIEDGKNGYRIPYSDEMEAKDKAEKLAERLITLFTEVDLDSFQKKSYDVAKQFLTTEVERKWKEIIKK